MDTYLNHPRIKYLTFNTKERCVMARITRRKILHQANFTLAQHGTWAACQAAAEHWVSKTLEVVPDPETVEGYMTSRNTSGIVGVRLVLSVRRRNGAEYPDYRWIAFWPGCPQTGGIGWSVNAYGDQQAFLKAVLARELRTTDRTVIDKRYQRFVHSAKAKKALAAKSQDVAKLA